MSLWEVFVSIFCFLILITWVLMLMRTRQRPQRRPTGARSPRARDRACHDGNRGRLRKRYRQVRSVTQGMSPHRGLADQPTSRHRGGCDVIIDGPHHDPVATATPAVGPGPPGSVHSVFSAHARTPPGTSTLRRPRPGVVTAERAATTCRRVRAVSLPRQHSVIFINSPSVYRTDRPIRCSGAVTGLGRRLRHPTALLWPGGHVAQHRSIAVAVAAIRDDQAPHNALFPADLVAGRP